MVRLALHLIRPFRCHISKQEITGTVVLVFKALWRASSDPKRLVSTTSGIEHRIRLPAREALPGRLVQARDVDGCGCIGLRLRHRSLERGRCLWCPCPIIPEPSRAVLLTEAGLPANHPQLSVAQFWRTDDHRHARMDAAKLTRPARKAWLPPDSRGATWHGASPASRKWEWLLQPAAPGGMLHPSFFLGRQTANDISID